MAEVHRSGADHAHDDQAERFQPALAQIDMRTHGHFTVIGVLPDNDDTRPATL